MQETFDAAVQENIDEFEMEVSRLYLRLTYRRMLQPRCKQQASVHGCNASATIPQMYRSMI
jgi:hypothetical protein